MIALLARLALGGLLKAGVSEGLAGRFVASRLFAPVALLLIGGFAVLSGKLALYLHDRHLTEVVQIQCEAEQRAAALAIENGALKQASGQKDDAIRERDLQIAQNETDMMRLKEINDALRNTAPGDGALVFDAGDPWVQAARDGGGAPPTAQQPRRR